MTNSPLSLPHSNRPARGFALIITVSLLVLLAVVAVGLLTLSSISVRAAGQGSSLAEARANARLGMMLALGEIQKQLGPDQRISAEAGLAHEEAGRRSHWVGTYRSWLDTAEERPDPEFLHWLVSGNQESLDNESAAGGSSIAETMVTLVDQGSLGKDAKENDRVEAGLIEVNGNQGIAWWVSDESTKIRSPRPATLPQSMVEARSELMSAPQAGIERLASFADVTRDDEDLTKAISTNSLELLGDGQADKHFHEITTASMSLVTNVRKGGFRKDLSMELQKSSRKRPTEPLYTVQDKKGGTKQGITIGELWDYYNLWKEVDYPSGKIAHPDGGSVPAELPFLRSKRDHRQAVNDPFYAYRRLTVLRNSWVVSLMARVEGTGANSHQLYLVLDPILTVWNPFDVAITIDRRAYQGFKYWGIPYTMNLTAGALRQQVDLNQVIGSNFVMSTLFGRVEPIVLRPGEVQVISQGTSDQTQQGRSGMVTDLRLGWNFGSGFRFKINKALAPANAPIRWDMKPRKDGHMGVALVEFLHYQGTPAGTYDPGSIWIGGLMVDRNLDLNDRQLQATDAPKYFPRLSSRSGGAFTMSSITNRKRPMMMISLDMKTEMDPIDEEFFQGRFHLRHNPKLAAYDIQSFDAATMATMPMQISVKALNSWKDPILDVGSTGLGYAGGGYTAEFGNSQIVTHSIPREPIYSLAAFQHAVANGSPLQYFKDHTTIAHYFLYPSISHAIGNSFAPSFLAPDQTEGTLNGSEAADHSYLANLGLWDDWFFSSIAPQTSDSWRKAGLQRDQRVVFEEFVGSEGAASKPLPNHRMRPWVPADTTGLVDEFFNKNTPKPEATARIAAHLLIEGGFNVNSTSVGAWRALFSSLRNRSVPVLDAQNPGPETLSQAQGVPSAALLTAGGEAIPKQGLDDPKSSLQWRGFRELDDEQIDELAEAMVAQVRLRGPFLSRADFVNRRLGQDKDLARHGALQAALDDDEVSINQDYLNSGRAISMAEAAEAGLIFPEAEAGAAAAGIPGYVKQADLLTSIGPMLQVRGDTFRIRSYGESRSKDGKTILARAWCEAVVQRIPEYMDRTDEPWRTNTELTSPLNQQFGRRFQVTQFRWLQPEEV